MLIIASRPPIRTIRSAQTYFPQPPQPARLSHNEAQSPEPDPQEELKQLGIRHGSFDRGQDNSISPVELSNSPDSIAIPIRRRSLLTPGIATRKTSREKIVRKSLPAQPSSSVGSAEPTNANDKRNFRKTLPAQTTVSQDELRQYFYDEFQPTSSPLEEISALETRRFSDLQQRAVTPSDLDYGHIGAYKLGSLRITNGTVSPAPSGPEPSYFDSKMQTQRDEDEVNQTPSNLPRDEEDETSGKIDDQWSGTFVNVKQSHVRFEFHEVSDEPPRIVETTVEIPNFSLGLSDFQSSASPRESSVFQSLETAYELAQAYMQEIAASPFSFEESSAPSPRLEATSKPTEIEDNLFDDEPGSTISLTPPVPQSVLQHSQRSIETQTSFSDLFGPFAKAESSQQSLQKMLHGPREQPAKPAKPLEKADSGYSSKTSLRSLRSRRSFTELGTSGEPSTAPTLAPSAPAVPNKSPPPTPPKNLYTRSSNEISFATSTVQGSKSPDTEYAPTTPAKDWSSRSSYGLGEALGSSQTSHRSEPPKNDDLPKPPRREAPPVPMKQTSTWSGWTGPPPLPIKSIEQTQAAAKSGSEALTIPERPKPNRRQSTPLPPYEKTMRPGLKPSSSDASISTLSRRLQKRGPVAQPGVIVQGLTEIEPSRIPPVSQEVSEHLEERLKNFPTLTHTYKSVYRTNSKETLATIFSMASAEQQAEEMQRMSIFQGLIPNGPLNEDIERPMNIERTRSSPGHGHRFSLMPKILRKSTERRSRRQSLESMSRNRSSSRGAEDHEIYITDLGAVSASLGTSPYDLTTTALAPISGNRSNDTTSSSRHGRHAVRGRTIGMDSQSAAQLARERSRSRENERRHSLRRQSYESRNSFEERAYLPTYGQRSKLATESAPPVPNIVHGQTQDYSLPKKMKSPPVSMRMPRKRMSSPPPKPSRAAPSVPAEIPRLPEVEHPQDQNHNETQRQQPAWQKQEHLWHDRKQSARETLSNARQMIDSTRLGSRRPSLEQQRQWSSQSLGNRSSFEQQTYPSQPKQQSYSHSSVQDHDVVQSYDLSKPWLDEKGFARASFDSSAGQNIRNAHHLNQSQSYTQMRSELLTVDRYNGGFGYGYEPGYGVGGSAGMRSGDTAASRKGVPGSLLWGVDFSDVPIIVMQRRDELEA
jgi:hypothetical protein